MSRAMTLGGWLVVALVATAGCGRAPAKWAAQAQQGEMQAKHGFEQHDAEAASQGAENAEEACEELESQSKGGEKFAEEAAKLLPEARRAAGSAHEYALLADEDHQCRVRLDKLKLKAYRSARATLCDYGLSGLAAAAEQLAQRGSNGVSEVERQAGSLAWDIVGAIKEGTATNAAPDWSGVARELRAWSKEPPPRAAMFLAAAFTLHGLTDFGLSEIESVDAARLGSTNAQAVYHLERSVLFAAHGWEKTASRELEQAAQLAPEVWSGMGSTQAMALVHVYRGGTALKRRDLAAAEAELAETLRLWPGQPLGVWLRAETAAARGEWEQAAQALEKQAGETTDPWLAERMNRRARELRETKAAGTTPFSDPVQVTELAAHSLGLSDGASRVGNWLQQMLGQARALGQHLAERVP